MSQTRCAAADHRGHDGRPAGRHEDAAQAAHGDKLTKKQWEQTAEYRAAAAGYSKVVITGKIDAIVADLQQILATAEEGGPRAAAQGGDVQHVHRVVQPRARDAQHPVDQVCVRRRPACSCVCGHFACVSCSDLCQIVVAAPRAKSAGANVTFAAEP